MKNIVVSILALVAFSLSASAQEKREFKHKDHGQGGMHRQHHNMFMMKELNLTDAQKQQAKANREDFKQKMQELNKNESITVKEMRDRKAALMKEQKAKMEALLTPEQKTKLEQMKVEQKQKADERFAKHLDKMKSDLGLTETQLTQLKTQRQDMRAKFEALKNNESLSREQKKEQFMALKEEAKEAHKKIFTPEQLKKMEEMKKKRFEKTPS